MRNRACYLVIFFLLVSAIDLPARRGPARPVSVLAIAYTFDGPHSDQVLLEVQNEVRRLFPLPGLQIVWRSLDDGQLSEAFQNLLVARFHGSCAVSYQTNPSDAASALGFTHVTDGQVIPFLQVDCNRVLRLTGRLRVSDPMESNKRRIGRAIARVLAHEMYHVLAETTEHTREGLASPALSGYDLTCEQFDFRPDDLDRIQDKIFSQADVLSADSSLEAEPELSEEGDKEGRQPEK